MWHQDWAYQNHTAPSGTRHFNDGHDFEIGLVAGVGSMVTVLVITCVIARFVAIRNSVTA